MYEAKSLNLYSLRRQTRCQTLILRATRASMKYVLLDNFSLIKTLEKIYNFWHHLLWRIKKKIINSFNTYIFLFSRGIILWIELPRPENPANTCTWHTETLDSCFDLIRFHHKSIPWSASREIEPATIECRAKTLPLRHQLTSHTSDDKLTSHGNCVDN